MRRKRSAGEPLPHVVIIGGGFAGLRAARSLRYADVTVTVIDRTNFHLFQPLLYQVATATLAPSDIAIPIRYVLRRQKNTTVLMAEVTGVNLAARQVHIAGEPEPISYDYLIIATGSRHAYFGNEQWEPLAPGLKTLSDALEIRRRLLLAYEQVELAHTEQEETALLTFTIVGGGPTGVELAGMVPELTRIAEREFRHADIGKTRVILIEAGPRLLPSMPEVLSDRARRDLEHMGVEVRLGAPVTDVGSDYIVAAGERIGTRTVIWAAGNVANPLGRQVALQAGITPERGGRLAVEPDLSLKGFPEVFIAGDLAAVRIGDQLIPAVAPAAMQMGRTAALNIYRSVTGGVRRPFRYTDKGNLATIGRARAVAAFLDDRLKIGGRLAWIVWLFVHLMYLVGFRNRVSVLLQWAYAYLSGRRGVYLIYEPSTLASARPTIPTAEEPVLPVM